MTSIYQEVMGEDFARLHPRIQERFGFSSADRTASIGTGIMGHVGRGRFFTLPFLCVGAWRQIMFPEKGKDVPFTIENYAYVDSFGRETVTWIRTFQMPSGRKRRFDATMINSKDRGLIVDYLGTHQHLAVDIHLTVDDEGGLRLRSGAQRFYEGPIAFRFPMLFSGVAEVREWFDDSIGQYRIKVEVRNRIWGLLFSYEGTFDVEVRQCEPGDVPSHVKPVREEIRE